MYYELTRREEIRLIVGWCRARDLQIVADDFRGVLRYDVHIAYRSCCVHGVLARLVKRILARKRTAKPLNSRLSTPPKPTPIDPRRDWGLKAAGDHTLD